MITKDLLRHYWADLRCLTIIPRHYKAPPHCPPSYWSEVMREYGNEQRSLECTDYRWRIITYDDGHKELAYLRVRKGGFLSGRFPAIYRGVIIPRMLRYGTFAHIKNIRLAF